MASNRELVARLAWPLVASMLVAIDAWSAECRISETSHSPVREEARPEIRPTSTSDKRTYSSGIGIGSGMPAKPPTADELQDREIRELIGKHDLRGLTAMLPKEVQARRLALRRSNAVDGTVWSGALPILRQILQWDPRALSDRDARTNGAALGYAAVSWRSALTRAREGDNSRVAGSEKEYLEIVRLLLEAGAAPDGTLPPNAPTPLETIAGNGASAEVAEASALLLKHGAKMRRDDAGGSAVLTAAAESGNEGLVKMLLSSNAFDQEALDEALVHSPLTAANYATLEALLQAGANINAEGERWKRPMYFPAETASLLVKGEGYEDLMRLFIRFKVDPNRAFRYSRGSALMNVMHRHGLMRGLIALHADVNYRSGTNWREASIMSPLLLATQVPVRINVPEAVVDELAFDPAVRAKSVAILLDAGADPNVMTRNGSTPLMMLGAEDLESARNLVAHGGKINMKHWSVANYSREGVPVGAVSWALLQGNDALAAAVLEGEKSLGADDCGAVYYAAQAGAARTLALLLERRADARLKTQRDGMTPLIVAAENGHVAAVRVLLERRAAKVDEVTSVHTQPLPYVSGLPMVPFGRQTALMRTTRRDHIEVMKELIARGADVNQHDIQGQTAIDYVKSEEARALLLAHGARK
jgi:ankyrin repeat protein